MTKLNRTYAERAHRAARHARMTLFSMPTFKKAGREAFILLRLYRLALRTA
jgi:hypothetical protein